MDSSSPPETERLLMNANLHRMRGELSEAEALVRAALERAPNDPYARELLGDLRMQRGDEKGAEAEYRSVLQDNPGRPHVEDKLARLVLKSTPIPVVTAGGTPLRSDRNPVTVAVFSLAFPGAGHYYLGDKIKGLIFGAIAVVILFAMIPSMVGTFQSVAGSVSTSMNNGDIPTTLPKSSGAGGTLVWIILFTALQLYAAYDSFMAARNAYRPK